MVNRRENRECVNGALPRSLLNVYNAMLIGRSMAFSPFRTAFTAMPLNLVNVEVDCYKTLIYFYNLAITRKIPEDEMVLIWIFVAFSSYPR